MFAPCTRPGSRHHTTFCVLGRKEARRLSLGGHTLDSTVLYDNKEAALAKPAAARLWVGCFSGRTQPWLQSDPENKGECTEIINTQAFLNYD